LVSNFEERPEDWCTSVLPYSDFAFDMSVRPHMANGNQMQGRQQLDEKKIREVFLRFFVAILMNYRKLVITDS
jgi:hypothetical protein